MLRQLFKQHLIGGRARHLPAFGALICGLALWVAPVHAQCDITDLPCWGPDKKCNIKFRNLTGEASGSGTGTWLNQKSMAATIEVSARKADRSRAGSNTLEILAGASKTLNLDKKKDFDSIRIQNTTNFSGAVLRVRRTCDAIRTTLQGSGTCKVWWGCASAGDCWTAITCSGGDVVEPN